MIITYYRYIDVAVATEYTDSHTISNEITLRTDDGRPISGHIHIGDSYLAISGTARVSNDLISGEMSLVYDGKIYPLGQVVAIDGVRTLIPHSHNDRILHLMNTLNRAYKTLSEYEVRLKELETATFGVDILDLNAATNTELKIKLEG